jgi:exportin-1
MPLGPLVWKDLNTICWAAGSISSALNETEERKFLIKFLRDLLKLSEAVTGKENKAVVASNVMYVVGQYPRFLKLNWQMLKIVTEKLFQFMRDSFPGVQEMSCDAFLKIANKCRHEFLIIQPKEPRPYVVSNCGFTEKIESH